MRKMFRALATAGLFAAPATAFVEEIFGHDFEIEGTQKSTDQA